MGRVFLEHFGGSYLFSCANCHTFLTNKSQLLSTEFTSSNGKAYLFNKVTNIVYGSVEDRVMTTGPHMIRDVSCKRCHNKLGWMYEFAFNDTEIYKEGHVVLEKAFIVLSIGFRKTFVMHYRNQHFFFEQF